MGNRRTFLYRRPGAEQGRRRLGHPGAGSRYKPVGSGSRNKTRPQSRGVMSKVIDATLPRKAAYCVEWLVTVPQTDSGGRVENTKALERSQVKELGKLTP